MSKATPKTGRPTACTPEAIETFTQKIREGWTKKMACLSVQISWTTFQNWLARGAQGEEPFVTFLEEYNDSRAFWAEQLISTIDEHRCDPKQGYQAAKTLWDKTCKDLEDPEAPQEVIVTSRTQPTREEAAAANEKLRVVEGGRK